MFLVYPLKKKAEQSLPVNHVSAFRKSKDYTDSLVPITFLFKIISNTKVRHSLSETLLYKHSMDTLSQTKLYKRIASQGHELY
jgi:hypothetical protein